MEVIDVTEAGEMNGIRFSIPGEPFGKQRPRVVHMGQYSKAYTPKETVNYENLIKIMYQQAAKGKRFTDDDMLDVRIIAYYGVPKSASKKRQRLMLEHKIRPTKKPDFDNIGKVVCDSLNQIAYRDDSQIVDAQVRKFYSETPKVDVIIKRIKF